MNPFKKAGDYRSVMSLLGRSIFIIEFLKRNPEAIQELAVSKYLNQKKDKNTLLAENQARFQACTDAVEIKKAIRYFKYVEMARILIRNFSEQTTFEETGQELSCLGAACTELAQEAYFKMHPWKFSVPCSFTTIGMGKLGGYDLNLSSDIDIIYIFDVPEELSTTAPMAEIFEKYTHAAENITQLLQDRTDDGIVFRVDLELRPQGKSGALVNSLDSIMTYYEIAGASWERSALIKANPIAGDMKLGQNFLKRILPFVYRRTIDPSIVLDLKKMKEKINIEMKNVKNQGFNLKLGIGGIREIEFFTSSFQLVYGGREILLRDRNTLRVLKVLKELKLIPATDATQLHEAYQFLRKTENYIQAREERQTHCLPTEDYELTVLAKMMKFETKEELLEKISKHTHIVADCFNNLAS
ncbi:MAG: hypothetical protein IPJ69_14080 [Deltaproteobacteria bacterium]|nr:MAG: hypothetical protein IPJ69_14080 [Deltaproteobacteria bacterium]